MFEYLESCFPGNAERRYEIVFSWGSYNVYTTGEVRVRVRGNAARYRGYIVACPSRPRNLEGRVLWVYLVTPDGEAWRRRADESLLATGRITAKRGWSGMSVDAPIASLAGPVIENFLTHREAWQRYGTLKPQDYGGYRLERISTDPSDEPDAE